MINKINGQEVSVSVNYELKASLKRDITVVVSSKTAEMINLMRDEINNIEVQLIYNNSESSFKIKEDMEVDDSKRIFFRERAKALFNIKDNYYCNLEKRIIMRETEFDGKNYHIVSNIDSVKWK